MIEVFPLMLLEASLNTFEKSFRSKGSLKTFVFQSIYSQMKNFHLSGFTTNYLSLVLLNVIIFLNIFIGLD